MFVTVPRSMFGVQGVYKLEATGAIMILSKRKITLQKRSLSLVRSNVPVEHFGQAAARHLVVLHRQRSRYWSDSAFQQLRVSASSQTDQS